MIILSMGVHYTLGDRSEVTQSLVAVAGLTKMSSPSFGVAYYEPRVAGLRDETNIAYPEMISIDRMDFVYAK